jgi:hypothetical protein
MLMSASVAMAARAATDALEIASAGTPTARPAFLLDGWPDDATTWLNVGDVTAQDKHRASRRERSAAAKKGVAT